MTETEFWNFIEKAWDEFPSLKTIRLDLLKEGFTNKKKLGEDLEKAIKHKVYPKFEEELLKLPKDQFYQLTEIHSALMDNLNSTEIHQGDYYTGDAFLYMRGFIIALGKEFYYSIDESPDLLGDKFDYFWSEEFAYQIHNLYLEMYHKNE